MAYVENNYYPDQGQHNGGYDYQQQDHYNQQHEQYNNQQHDQYNQSQSHDHYNQSHDQYNPQNHYEQPPPAYDQSNQHETHNESNNHGDSDRSFSSHFRPQERYGQTMQQHQQQQYNHQLQQYQHQQVMYQHQQYQYQQQQLQYQMQQWTPHHAPYAPPTGVQSFAAGTNMHFQYSDLHGARKALLIGINYYGGKAPLRGCINDVHNIKDFLISGYRFQQSNMWIMTDDQTDPRSMPTRQNILTGMQWLVSGAKPGDDLFLHFSGHGGPVKDADGDEDDGYDEAIFPVDSDRITNGPGYIVDDLIHDICVKRLPEGCRLTAIFDCCHSGSIMDLPYMYSTKGVLKEPNFLKDTGNGLMGIGAAYMQQDVGSMIGSATGLLKKAYRHANGHHKKVRAAKTSPADVICFSGCKDVQTSADATIAGQGQGAMSHAFKNSLVKYGGNLTYIQLLNAIRDELQKGNYAQKPQLSACHPIDLDLLFTL